MRPCFRCIRSPLTGSLRTVGVDPEVADFSVQRRTTDAEAPGDFRHLFIVSVQRYSNCVVLDVAQRTHCALRIDCCDREARGAAGYRAGLLIEARGGERARSILVS